jgi:hypothetical protein
MARHHRHEKYHARMDILILSGNNLEKQSETKFLIWRPDEN